MEQQLFLVEGEKQVAEVLESDFITEQVFHVPEWNGSQKGTAEFLEVSAKELEEISQLETPNKVLAVVRMRQETEVNIRQGERYLFLDNIRDPGNMGTLLRIADWFGLAAVFCSDGCVEVYNPKVVQSAMGSLFRMPVYTTGASVLADCPVPVYGAMMEGEDVYKVSVREGWMLVIGNEGSGISEGVRQYLTHKVTIPSFTRFEKGAESLNAAVAAGVICSELVRKGLK